MNKFSNMVKFFINIMKKNPILFSVVLLSPIFSGCLTIYVYNSQVLLINAVTMSIEHENIMLKEIFQAIKLFVTINIVQLCVDYICKCLATRLGTEVGWKFQDELVTIANRIDLIKLDDKEFHDKLSRAKELVGNELLGIVNDFVNIINQGCSLYSIIFLTIEYRLYYCSLLITFMLVINVYIKVKTEIKVKNLNREMTFDGRVADYLSGLMDQANAVRELRIYGGQNFYLELWKKKFIYQNSKRYGARKFEIRMGIIVSGIQIITTFFIIYILIKNINNNVNITIGLLSVLFLNLIQCKNKIFDILWPICSLYASVVKMQDFNDVLKYKNILNENKNYNIKDPTPLLVNKIEFYYKQNNLIFKDLSIKILPGEKVAVVGKNGAGKSTFIKLLLGLYAPTKGEIIWNGETVCPKKVAVVFQNYAKYDLTLRENISLGNISRINCDNDIVDIIKKCGLDDLYMKLGGLDVPLGYTQKNGMDISVGQWQRVAIARALYSEANLLIFDEPTAAIDPKTEVEIFKMLIELCKNKTAIFVSHRLGWTKECDRIVVLDNGKVIEQGNYDELMAKKGEYYQMYKAQSFWYQN